jgi:hypothetical protein
VTVLLAHGLRGDKPIAEQRRELGDGASDRFGFWLFEHDRQFLPGSATPASGATAEAFAAIGTLAAISAFTAEAILIEGTTPIRIVDAPIAGIAARTLAIEIIRGTPVVGALPAILGAALPAIIRVLIDVAIMIRIDAAIVPRTARVAIDRRVTITLECRVTI